MKILFIAGHSIRSNSSVTMMNLAYVKGLVDAGCDVRIITSKLPNNHIAYDSNFKIPNEVIVDEYNISPAFNILSSKKSKKGTNDFILIGVKKLLRKIYYRFSIYDSQKSWIKNVQKVDLNDEYYDIIISSSDPKHSHLFAMELITSGKVRYGKWVQLWGDPMYLDITRRGTFLDSILLKEEERIINNADKILYVSPFTAIEQRRLFPKQAAKIDYILIPYFRKDESLSPRAQGERMIFGYYGDYNSNVRNLEPLYQACREGDVGLIIRGNSDKPFESTASIDVKNRITIKELQNLESHTDVFIHLCNKKGTQIPAKVYYYSGTKKPILFILDGEVNKIKSFFEPFGRYIFCENNKESILSAINMIRYNGYKTEETRILEEFSPTSVAKELLIKIGVG